MLLVTVPDRHLMDIGFLFLILEDPAFSLPMRLRGHLPWARFLMYSLVQLLSVFCASGVPYALYDGNREQGWGHLCMVNDTAEQF